MHTFPELVHRCTVFTLNSLHEVHEKTLKALETSGDTSLVKNLQMIQLEKVILVVGMFSIFDAILQNRLNSENGFAEAKSILEKGGEIELLEEFKDYVLAINALKHGKGHSYNKLIAKENLSIQAIVKNPNEDFFSEGNVSEISGLVQVNDEFIENCAQLIARVSLTLQKIRPDIHI